MAKPARELAWFVKIDISEGEERGIHELTAVRGGTTSDFKHWEQYSFEWRFRAKRDRR